MLQFLMFMTLTAAGGPFQEPPGLAEAVSNYWNLLMNGQAAQAEEFVLPETRGSFSARGVPLFRSWRLVGITGESANEATVEITMERLLPKGVYDWTVTEVWVQDENRWRVRVVDPVSSRKEIYQGSGPEPTPGVLKVLPESMRVHLTSRTQRDSLVVLNGLEMAVYVVHFGFDRDRFEWVERLSSVGPGESGRMTLRYKGSETEKNLVSEAVLVLKYGSKESRFSVPITYNYISPGARGLFGLSESAAGSLERSAPLAPKVATPQQEK